MKLIDSDDVVSLIFSMKSPVENAFDEGYRMALEDMLCKVNRLDEVKAIPVSRCYECDFLKKYEWCDNQFCVRKET